VIEKLREFQIGQYVRDDGPQATPEESGDADDGRPADLHRDPAAQRCCGRTCRIPFVWLVMFSTLAYGAIGFADDYIKVVRGAVSD
jgi:phospho-N-acetylmuramoyl-pentapeptide-transferase